MEQLLAELERIVVERQDWLFRFAYMRIGNREDAKDVVQEVLLGVFKRLRDSTKVDSAEHYLIRSINNACTDYIQRRPKGPTQSRPLKIVSLDKAEHIPIDESDRQIHEEYLRINKLLDSLSDEQAEIVRLKCYDELTFRQIAELLNIPEPTAKSRYRYAIMHIQHMIKKKGDER